MEGYTDNYIKISIPYKKEWSNEIVDWINLVGVRLCDTIEKSRVISIIPSNPAIREAAAIINCMLLKEFGFLKFLHLNTFPDFITSWFVSLT